MQSPGSVFSLSRISSASSSLCVIALLLTSAAFAAGPNEQVLYSFQGGADGYSPYSSLVVDKSGNLYGTTNYGGSSNCPIGCGTVFEVSPPSNPGGAWTETILYRFLAGNDGAFPQDPLVFDAAGNLYGTTSQGGTGNCSSIQLPGCGTVFELSPPAPNQAGWTYRQIYSFQGVPSGQGKGDGAWPAGLAFAPDGSLFGFAYSGGFCEIGDDDEVECGGAAFRLQNRNGAWSESIVYRFLGPDFPYAGPSFDKQGNLYGAGPGGTYGFGAIFRLEPGAKPEATLLGLYNFHGVSGDGAFPNFGLAFDPSGNLYASTSGTPEGSYPNVIELSPTKSGEWNETVLFDFNPISTGDTPLAGPILASNGDLYGTTAQGGAFDYGLVYQLTPPGTPGSWTENVLFSFSIGTDGFAPDAGLVFGKGGALYGTTPVGGDPNCGPNGNGCGVVYRVAP